MSTQDWADHLATQILSDLAAAGEYAPALLAAHLRMVHARGGREEIAKSFPDPEGALRVLEHANV